VPAPSLAPPERVHHPIFARFYQRLSAGGEKAGAGEHRRELLASLTDQLELPVR
jgi:hypothetical protein